MDAVLMFETLVLGALYNLSDDQIEYQVRDRLSFMRFLGLGLEDRVPDAKTVWLCHEALVQAGMVEELFRQFDAHLARRGYIARGGQTNDMGGTLVRSIGLVRAKARIGMKNLAYNMRRLVQLRRINPCPA